MRSLLIVGAGAALAVTGAADAQRVISHGPGASYGMPGRGPMVMPNRGPVVHQPVVHPMPGPAPVMHRGGMGGGGRWGSKVGGRWWGGANAPGGWSGYRQPVRGWVLPSYWYAPRFYVNDWQTYGFRAPAAGYTWVRYYDDAVLVDGRGSVYDSVPRVDWDRYDGGYAGGQVGGGYAEQAYYGDADVRYRDDARYRDGGRRDNGLGGAAVGAVAGGVAGNLIGGRGNRLGGTLIGAGVGAAAGYAIDRAEDRGRGRGEPPIAPDYAPGYAPPPPPPPPVQGYYPGAPSWVSPDGRTTVITNGGGYGGSTTTVVVQSAPVVTTTVTEEVFEDRVTYTKRPIRSKVVRWRKPACRCK